MFKQKAETLGQLTPVKTGQPITVTAWTWCDEWRRSVITSPSQLIAIVLTSDIQSVVPLRQRDVSRRTIALVSFHSIQ